MKIHVWEINGFVKLNQKYANHLDQQIIKRFGSLRKLANKCGVDRKIIARVCQREGKGFVKISNLFKFTDYLNIERNILERHVEFYKDSRAGAYSRLYRINFPFIITPKAIRLISHIIGDGSVYRDCVRYSQKDVSYIKKLAENIIKPTQSLPIRKRFENGKQKEQVFDIPMIVIKCVCKYLNISPRELKSHLFIERCLLLPKDFRIQVLAAIMVDEGCIESKIISLENKKSMEAICKLIDSLSYKRGKLKLEESPHKYKDKIYIPKMYKVRLHAEGLRDFLKDLKISVRKYDNLLDMWNKQKKIENRVAQHDYLYLEKINKTKILRNNIIRILQNEKVIRREDLINRFNANPDNIDFILKTLQEKEIAVRMGHGAYSYVRK